MRFTKHFGILLVSILSAFAGERPNSEMLRRVADDYFAKRPTDPLPMGVSFDEALKSQAEFVNLIKPKLGPVVGYKVGLVTPTGQQRYKIDHPVRGVLLKDMLLPNNSKVSAHYGTQPILEADLIVRVKDEGINGTKTVREAAQHLSEVVCFIELADTYFKTNAPLDAGGLVAANVGARSGILGEARKFEATPEFLNAFGTMKLVLKDSSDRELSRVGAEGLLGHPMNAVAWFVQDMNKHGERLKAGDVVSLGSPSPQVVPRKGTYTLVYEGLPGGPISAMVSVE